MKSKCGQKMNKVVLDEYDFSDLAGLPVVVRDIRILRCAKCGEELMLGAETDRIMKQVALAVVNRPERLGANEARFLRGHLGLTQKELAERMGLHKITVAAWESKKPISPQHDHILRAMVLAKLMRKDSSDLLALEHVHTAKPRRAVRRLVVERLAS
ncbi:MAG: helix-turn-helix domain-containing protein [Deltaproteobacteria bacterium]|nr:helix-turn-helix domain-containing protein [Deltaproteobacteria bacterium]